MGTLPTLVRRWPWVLGFATGCSSFSSAPATLDAAGAGGVPTVDGGATNDAPYDPCATGACDLVMFVSSKRFSGNIGGVLGADAECQRLAQEAHLPRSERFHSWLVGTPDGRVEGHQAQISPNRSYKLPNDARILIADNGSNLTSGNLRHAITADEKKTEYKGTVWTNAAADGSRIDNSCGDFTTTSGNGTIGDATSTSTSWAARSAAGTSASCAELLPIYCVESPD